MIPHLHRAHRSVATKIDALDEPDRLSVCASAQPSIKTVLLRFVRHRCGRARAYDLGRARTRADSRRSPKRPRNNGRQF